MGIGNKLESSIYRPHLYTSLPLMGIGNVAGALGGVMSAVSLPLMGIGNMGFPKSCPLSNDSLPLMGIGNPHFGTN